VSLIRLGRAIHILVPEFTQENRIYVRILPLLAPHTFSSCISGGSIYEGIEGGGNIGG